MELQEVVPWGRTLAEYQSMFELSERDLQSQILGCGDGPASFNAEMTALGHTVISIDPIYQFSAAEIERRVRETYETIVSQLKQNSHRYIWKKFQDAEDLGRVRLGAMERFLLDYEAGKTQGRYRDRSLPELELETDRFDLCLCSHLLFLYSQQLSLDFHLAAIVELLRVAKEVRIFPLLKLDGEPSPYVEPAIEFLTARGFDVQIQPVAYEFQRGGDRMMKISRQ